MKHTDMELQAIREKLQMLQAEPPAAETLTLPWSDARSDGGSAARADAKEDSPVNQSPQAIAIETLKQRSRGSDQATKAHIDYLVSQELFRLEAQASSINERSQQQAMDIMTLKRSAQAAAVGLRRQGIHDHPQLAAITQFLDRYESAAVPLIERNDQGFFALSYNTIDFHQAEHEAINTANVLRNRRRVHQVTPFSQPVEPAANNQALKQEAFSHEEFIHEAESRTDRLSQLIENSSAWLKATFRKAFNSFSHQASKTKNRRHRRRRGLANSASNDWEEGFVENGPPVSHYPNDTFNHQFTWLDGTIWFSGAAIARIVVQPLLAFSPLIENVLLIGLVGIIAFALYRVIVEKSPNYTMVYRLCIGMMGLFLGGLF